MNTLRYAPIPTKVDEGVTEYGWYRIVQSYEILRTLHENIGPCVICGQMLDRVEVRQTTHHTSASRPDAQPYTMIFDWFGLHPDGTPPHDGVYDRWLPACPSCGAYTLETSQLAYGDETSCSTCSYRVFRDIGD